MLLLVPSQRAKGEACMKGGFEGRNALLQGIVASLCSGGASSRAMPRDAARLYSAIGRLP
jgi:hypothetical protein